MQKKTVKQKKTVMQKRTFKISQIVSETLDIVSGRFNINKATIARLAVYHGIEKIRTRTIFNEKIGRYEENYGYLPVRDHHRKSTVDLEIHLPEDTWTEFFIAMDKIRQGLEDKLIDGEPIPDGEMIELFLKIELRRFKLLLDEYEEKKEEETDYDNFYKYNKNEKMNIDIDIPVLLYDEMKMRQERVGIKQTQMGKYLGISACIHEHFQQDFDTIDTDADLLKEIEILGLDRLKTMTLLRYLIESNRIVWNSWDD